MYLNLLSKQVPSKKPKLRDNLLQPEDPLDRYEVSDHTLTKTKKASVLLCNTHI